MKQVKHLLSVFILFIVIGTQIIVAQNTASSQSSYNIVGKWFYGDKGFFQKFNNDGTYLFHVVNTEPWRLPGTDIEYLVKSREITGKWCLDGDIITLTTQNQKIVLGDNSYYPADIQKQIKEDIEQKEKI